MPKWIWLDRLIVSIVKNVLAVLYLLFVLLYMSFWFLLPIFLWLYFGMAIRDSYAILGKYFSFIVSLIIVMTPYLYVLIRIPLVVDTISRFPALLLKLGTINNEEFDRASLFRLHNPLSVEYALALKESKIEYVVKYPENDYDTIKLVVHQQIRNALNKQRCDAFTSLLSQIEDVDAKKDDIKDGFRPLLYDVVETGEYEYVAAVLDHGAKINNPDNYRGGITSLHLACEKGYLEIVRLLIACGADVNAKDQWGHTPLWYASTCHGGFPEIVELLIANKADIDATDKSGKTVLDSISTGELEGKKATIRNVIIKQKSAD